MQYKLLSNNRLDRFYVFARMINHTRKKTKYAQNRVKMIGGGYNGSEREFRDVVVAYWKKYGVKPKKFWYDLYCNGKTGYDPRFVPDAMWYRSIIPHFNNILLRQAYVDKAMYSRLLQGVKKPDTIVKRIDGRYYNGDQDMPISREEAEAICEKETHLILKPSTYSGGGAGVQFYDNAGADAKPIGELFDSYASGFVVQRIVKQHPDLARINSSSLNTVRVMSFRFKGQVRVLSAQLRMGGAGSRVDNISSGGISCAVQDDGRLREKAVNRKSQWTDEHPSGIKFRDIRVPSYEKIVETVKRLHASLPYFDIIGWDFAVDEDGEPVFIEFNVMPEQNQIGNGSPTFGDLSEEVFDEVFQNK